MRIHGYRVGGQTTVHKRVNVLLRQQTEALGPQETVVVLKYIDKLLASRSGEDSRCSGKRGTTVNAKPSLHI